MKKLTAYIVILLSINAFIVTGCSKNQKTESYRTSEKVSANDTGGEKNKVQEMIIGKNKNKMAKKAIRIKSNLAVYSVPSIEKSYAGMVIKENII